MVLEGRDLINPLIYGPELSTSDLNNFFLPKPPDGVTRGIIYIVSI